MFGHTQHIINKLTADRAFAAITRGKLFIQIFQHITGLLHRFCRTCDCDLIAKTVQRHIQCLFNTGKIFIMLATG